MGIVPASRVCAAQARQAWTQDALGLRLARWPSRTGEPGSRLGEDHVTLPGARPVLAYGPVCGHAAITPRLTAAGRGGIPRPGGGPAGRTAGRSTARRPPTPGPAPPTHPRARPPAPS